MYVVDDEFTVEIPFSVFQNKNDFSECADEIYGERMTWITESIGVEATEDELFKIISYDHTKIDVQTITDSNFSTYRYRVKLHLVFYNEEDAVAYKLRWI